MGKRGFDECLNAAVVGRGDGARPGEPEGVKLAGCDVRIQAFGLVDGDGDCFSRSAELGRDVLVAGGQALAPIHHEYDGIGFLDGVQGLGGHRPR